MPAFYKEWMYKAKLSLMARVITKPQPKAVVFAGQNSALELCAAIPQWGAETLWRMHNV